MRSFLKLPLLSTLAILILSLSTQAKFIEPVIEFDFKITENEQAASNVIVRLIDSDDIIASQYSNHQGETTLKIPFSVFKKDEYRLVVSKLGYRKHIITLSDIEEYQSFEISLQQLTDEEIIAIVESKLDKSPLDELFATNVETYEPIEIIPGFVGEDISVSPSEMLTMLAVVAPNDLGYLPKKMSSEMREAKSWIVGTSRDISMEQEELDNEREFYEENEAQMDEKQRKKMLKTINRWQLDLNYRAQDVNEYIGEFKDEIIRNQATARVF